MQFYLEQKSAVSSPVPLSAAEGALAPGPIYGGFRPFQLDDLLGSASRRPVGAAADGEAIQRMVLDVWMERADVIRQWQLRLREEPADRTLVAGTARNGTGRFDVNSR